jgi:hypothetical protein
VSGVILSASGVILSVSGVILSVSKDDQAQTPELRLPGTPKRDVVVLPGKRKGEIRQRDRARSGAYEAPDGGRSMNQEIW